jgi:hypothetical protein
MTKTRVAARTNTCGTRTCNPNATHRNFMEAPPNRVRSHIQRLGGPDPSLTQPRRRRRRQARFDQARRQSRYQSSCRDRPTSSSWQCHAERASTVGVRRCGRTGGWRPARRTRRPDGQQQRATSEQDSRQRNQPTNRWDALQASQYEQPNNKLQTRKLGFRRRGTRNPPPSAAADTR